MDYTRYAVQEQLKELHIMQEHEVTQMMYEAAFLESCYETGVIGVLEATEDNLFKGLIDALKQFFANMKSLFKRRSIALYDKKFTPEIIQTLKNNLDTLQSNAKKLSPRKDVPYWKGDVKQQSSAVIAAVNKAVRNISTNNVKDYTYAKAILGNDGTNLLEHQDTAMTEYLKNYFRYGGVGDVETKRVTISGTDIAGMLGDMIDYIDKYTQEYASIPGKTSDEMTATIDKIKIEEEEKNNSNNTNSTSNNNTQANTESLSPDLYLSVEEKYLCETLLPIMINYDDAVLEAKNDKKKEQTDEQKKVEKAKEKEKQDGGGSPTKSTPIDPEAEKEQKEEAKENDKTAKISSKDYFNRLKYFAQVATTAFQTSIEERYLYYVDVLEDCGAREFEKSVEEQQKAAEQAKIAEQKAKEEAKAEKKKKKKGIFRRNK